MSQKPVPMCPNCGSTAIESLYADDERRASLQLSCNDCGHTFSEADVLYPQQPNPIEDDPDFEGYPGGGGFLP